MTDTDDDPEILPCRCGKRPVLQVYRSESMWRTAIVCERIRCEACGNCVMAVHDFGEDGKVIQSWNEEYAA